MAGLSTRMSWGPTARGNLKEEASYGQNNWLFNPPPGVTAIQGRAAKSHWRNMNVRRASEIPVFADTMWRGGGPSPEGERGDPPLSSGQWVNANAEMKHFCIDRHNGFVNHLFLDWTVRPVGLKELWTFRWQSRLLLARTMDQGRRRPACGLARMDEKIQGVLIHNKHLVPGVFPREDVNSGGCTAALL